MKNRLWVLALLGVQAIAFSQPAGLKAEKYPSLLWEITGKGLTKPSYLFGTMHVSSKMVFHLSDSFYVAIRRAQVVALETDPATWQDNFSRYDLEGDNQRFDLRKNRAPLQDYLTIGTFRLTAYEKNLEGMLSGSPSLINSFLYRNDSESGSDFEEDTYLDLHIFQTGKKLGKKICGVEDFDGSMQLVKEAYRDAAREKKRSRSFSDDDEFSYTRLEEAYRTGNLDLLDTINKVNSQSAAFDEKFLYRRNEIQALSIDSILKTGSSLFAGVGAAHLPGTRGVIEMLRSRGYHLRPVRIRAGEGRTAQKGPVRRMPVAFIRQTAADGFYTVSVPGKLYNFGASGGSAETVQYADMVNGSYYMVTRLATQAALLGQSETRVLQKIDSVLYENIPGRILQKKAIQRNGYRGIDLTARTRRGDVQRYHLFVTPFEILLFKMSGNGNYVREGTEAERFFGSIQLKNLPVQWKAWTPAAGGFQVSLPHPPVFFPGNWQVYAAFDPASQTAVAVLQTSIHNHSFLEADSFQLALVEESFGTSDNIARVLRRQPLTVGGYPALDALYRCNDSSVLSVRFLLRGPRMYALVAAAPTENRAATGFLQSFTLLPFRYGTATTATDSLLRYRVQTPVDLEPRQKLPFYTSEEGPDNDDSLVDNGTDLHRVVSSAETGEKIAVSYHRPSAYFYSSRKASPDSSTEKKEWVLRHRSAATLATGIQVTDLEWGYPGSSAVLKEKFLTRNGAGYTLQASLDTLSGESDFIRSFFTSFQPLDSFTTVDATTKKTGLFFEDFFSNDSVRHQKALKNLGTLLFDETDLPKLKRCLASLAWTDPTYLDTKKALMAKLALIRNPEATALLRTAYHEAGDTLALLHAALEALLAQKTALSYKTFGELVEADPPVLPEGENSGETDHGAYRVPSLFSGNDFAGETQNGYFFDNLTDSLELTAGIVKHLLPLLNLSDYRQPVMEVLATLADSALLSPAAYRSALAGLLPEAKQAWKKQRIREQTRAIEKAKSEREENGAAADWNEEEPGNRSLTRTTTLLIPFWNEEPQVRELFANLLRSTDPQLLYNTGLLLLRHGHPVPDALWQHLAALDAFRMPLYGALEKQASLSLFPAEFRNRLSLARSLLSTGQYGTRPDTLVFLQALPVQSPAASGELYFFKYREKKDDQGWRLATAGLFPSDSSHLVFTGNAASSEEREERDFTGLGSTKLLANQPVIEQLEKLRKKLVYSRRKSAVQFYNEESRYGSGDRLWGRN